MKMVDTSRREFVRNAAAGALSAISGMVTERAFGLVHSGQGQLRPPNVVFVLYDDMGWGDLGCYGAPIRTPNIDRFATAGMRFTDCVSGAPLCSPSRAALLTGRYPVRVGAPSVFQADDKTGMNLDETTLPEILKKVGYRTACVGKWHLGHQRPYLPTHRGFDSYYGIPYSNDMNPPCLMRGEEIIEMKADLTRLTENYTAECVNFIEANKDAPFFLYHPQTFPHVPLAASPRFRGKSQLGLYGDVIEECDWGFGEILAALRRTGVERETLVIVSSDNGPWWQGNPGPHRTRKGNPYEGGVAVPFIARWPGRIQAGSVNKSLISFVDMMPTLTKVAGGRLPEKPLDGVDVWPALSGKAAAVDRDILMYFGEIWPQCARRGKWKLHMARYNFIRVGGKKHSQGLTAVPLARPELYNLEIDPGENYDVAPENPEIVRDLIARFERMVKTLPPEVQRAYAEVMAKKVEQNTEPASVPIVVP